MIHWGWTVLCLRGGGGNIFRAAYYTAETEVRLRVWAPKYCGTSACIRSIVNMVMLKLMMFIRREASSGIIHLGSKVTMIGSSA